MVGPELALRELAPGPLVSHFGEQRVQLPARNRGKMSVHPSRETRDERAAPRHDDEGPLVGVVQREGYALRVLRETHMIEDEPNRGLVAIKRKREIRLQTGDAVESLEEMMRVRHDSRSGYDDGARAGKGVRRGDWLWIYRNLLPYPVLT